VFFLGGTIMNKRLLLSLSLLACLAGGCKPLGYLAYLFAPDLGKVTVPAEFDRLQGKKVAVVLFTDEATQVDYPYARWTLSQQIEAALKANVRKIDVVPIQRVIRYQDENIEWNSVDRTRVGKDLGADYVLYVAVEEYSTLEPGSMSLFRGRISARASVFDTSLAERAACVWRSKPIRVVYPESAPARLAQDDREIRYRAEQLFAQELVRKFYTHKVPKEQG